MSALTLQQPLIAQFRRFYPYLFAVRRQALLSAVFVLLTPLFAAVLLWSFKILIDDILATGNTELLSRFVFIYAAAAATKVAIEYATQYVENTVVETIILSLRADLYRHVLSLSPGSLSKNSPGDILARLQGDANRTEYLVYTGPLALLADGAAAVVYIGFLFMLSWQLTLCALVAIPGIVWVVRDLAGPIRKSSRLSRRAESQWMSLAEERLDAIPVVHAFGAEEREGRAFATRCNKVRRMEIASRMLQARQSALVEAIVAAVGLGVLAYGAVLISAGALTAGSLVAFIGTVGSLYGPIRALAKSSGRFQHAAAGAQRVADLLDCLSLVTERAGAHTLARANSQIEFRNVSFAYPGTGQPVLCNVSLAIEPGQTIAIVGPSGSGKSSLLRLMMRQYDCDSGAVLIGGRDVRNVTLTSLRSIIAPVFQDPLVLSGSIEKNIRYGAPDVPAARVGAVARAAAVDAFSSQKEGMLTTVGPRGSRLSGGQRQRIGLARALLKAAPILLLDEATAGVDSETETFIQQALDDLSGHHTIVVVAHRLSTVISADRVIVVENGRVVEDGRPSELLSKRSRCRTLFEAQIVQREAAE